MEKGQKNSPHNSHQLKITCECGFKIPVVRDASKLGLMIEKHIEEHLQKIKDPKEAAVASERLNAYLCKQVIEILAPDKKS